MTTTSLKDEIQSYKVYCPSCEDEMFEGNPKEIELWAKKEGHDGYLDWDDIEFATTLCHHCSWLVQM